MTDTADQKQSHAAPSPVRKGRYPGPDDPDGAQRVIDYFCRKLNGVRPGNLPQYFTEKANKALRAEGRRQWIERDVILIFYRAIRRVVSSNKSEFSEDDLAELPASSGDGAEASLGKYFLNELEQGADNKWFYECYGFLNAMLALRRASQWNEDVARCVWRKACRIEQQRLEREERAMEARRARGGRGATYTSIRVNKIMATLGCKRRWAYEIERDGTAVFVDRVKLAQAFANDPEWCKPMQWEPVGKQRMKGRPEFVDRSMRGFVMAQQEAFELDTPALERMADLYRDGALPDTFAHSGEFLKEARQHGVDPAEAFHLWERFEAWREKPMNTSH